MLTLSPTCGFGSKRAGLCSCCGDRVVTSRTDENPRYRRLHLRVIGSPLCDSTFITMCPECVAHGLDEGLLDALNRQTQRGWEDTPRIPPAQREFYRSLRITGIDTRERIQTWAEVN